MQQGSRPGKPEGFTMFLLRAWMWLVPVAMLVASVIFSVIAALDERWGLLAVMLLIGVFAIALLVLHWWLMYRFGSQTAGGEQ